MKIEIENPSQELLDKVAKRQAELGFSTPGDYLAYLIHTADSKPAINDLSKNYSAIALASFYRQLDPDTVKTRMEVLDAATSYHVKYIHDLIVMGTSMPAYDELDVGNKKTVGRIVSKNPVLSKFIKRQSGKYTLITQTSL